MNKEIKVLLVLLSVSLLIYVIWIVYILVDFYNDWKCSTTTDINWFIENNCQKYMNDK